MASSTKAPWELGYGQNQAKLATKDPESEMSWLFSAELLEVGRYRKEVPPPCKQQPCRAESSPWPFLQNTEELNDGGRFKYFALAKEMAEVGTRTTVEAQLSASACPLSQVHGMR